MDCSICFSAEELCIKCSRFNCDLSVCKDCLNRMIEYCHDNFKTMPCCVGEKCAGEFLHNQIAFVLSDANATKYAEICRKRLDEIDETSRKTRNEKDAVKRATKKLVETFAAEARARLTIVSPAIAQLIVISGLETKMTAIKKRNAKRVAEVTAKQAQAKCISFACKGSLVADDGAAYSTCDRCSIRVCEKCKCVFGTRHECKRSELESAAALAEIAKCPRCNVPAVRGEGCVFITCPYCNVNFDSNSGEETPHHGGHNPGTLVRVERTSLVDSTDSTEMKALLMMIEKAKPAKATSCHPAIKYNKIICANLYAECVNLIYEYRENGKLTVEVLKDMLIYCKSLTR
jgi:hypothetical protein